MDVLKRIGVLIGDIERNSETDVEHKVIIPYLEQLGYGKESGASFIFRVSKMIPVGSRLEEIIPDVAIYMDGQPFIMLESKPINRSIQVGDKNEAVSNGRLYEFPKMFPRSVVSTGLKWEVYETSTGRYLGDHRAVPHIDEAKDILEGKVPEVTDAERREAERMIATRILIKDEKKLRSLFEECKTRINAEGKRFQLGLSEMSKLILAKIYEEQYSVQENRPDRFSTEFIEEQLKARPRETATSVVNEVFREANDEYRGDRTQGIFPEKSEITLSPGTVKRMVSLLEPYAFYGSGEDIKGAVYEVFLKEMFRGEFGQYFTPREIVGFIIELIDPKPGEKIIDPACGSGGFLIHTFIEVRKRILEMDISDKEKEMRIENLLERDLWGVDIDEVLVQFCKINLLIHGDGYKNIFKVDALRKGEGLLEDERFDIVVTNPPFDLPSEHLEEIIGDYHLYQESGYKGADVLYMERCYELLNPGGRMAIVVPHRFVDRKDHANLRRWILDRFVPRAIVVLPVGAFKPFGGSNARTAVYYLRKPKDEGERRGKCLIATVRYVGFEVGISDYKPIPYNDLEATTSSPEYYQLKAEEEAVHGLR